MSDASKISYVGPLSEDEYLDVVLSIQKAMAIEPFQPSLVDVVKLVSDWRTLTNDIERLTTEVRANEIVLSNVINEHDRLADKIQAITLDSLALTQENERLLADNATLSVECSQYQRKLEEVWQEVAELRARVSD